MLNHATRIKILSSEYMPKHETRKMTVRFEAHNFVKWLSKFFPINPYIEAEYPDYCDPIYLQKYNTIVCAPRQFDLLRAEIISLKANR